jgi:hypothetical protein
MSFDLQKILARKRALRRDLAQRDVLEKLQMLDVLRERELAIRGLAARVSASELRTQSAPWRTKPE